MLQVRKLVLAVAAATSMASGMAHALGLGEVSVKSALNEPLVAEIELLDTKGLSTDEIRSKLASAEDFSRAGVDRQFFLNSLKFTPVIRQDGKSFVRVTSAQAVREPFLNFLLEVYWPAGRLLKEYTLLLDPPMYAPQELVYQSAPATAPATTRAPERRVSTTIQPRSTVESTPARRPAAQPALQGDQYRVQKNDTLWEIALRANRSGGSVHQVMLAIQDLNPDAFIDGNINRLKSGQVLKLPSADQVRQRSRTQAVAEFQSQVDAWRGGAPVERQLDARQRETAAAAPAQAEQGDNLRLVAGETGQTETGSDTGSSDQALADQLALTKEQLDSTRLQNEDLSSRVEELNSQVEKLQRLLELKNTQLANLQNLDDEEQAALETAAEELEAFVAETDEAEEAAAEVASEELLAGDVEVAAEDTEVPEAEAEAVTETADDAVISEPAEAEEAEEAAAEIAVAKVEAEKPADDETAAAEPKPAPAPAPVAFEPPPEPKGFLEELMENPMALPAAGGGAALLLLLLLLRRRQQAKQEQEQEVLPPEEFDQRSEDEDVLGDVDDDLSILDGALEDLDSAMEEPAEFIDDLPAEEPETADPIVEAENFIAFGRFSQAADLLLQAIDADPQREDLRFKLLEVYADLEDRNAFLQQVEELNAMGASQSEMDAMRQRFPHMLGEDDGGLSLDDIMLEMPESTSVDEAEETSGLGDMLVDDIPALDDLLSEAETAAADEATTADDDFASLLETADDVLADSAGLDEGIEYTPTPAAADDAEEVATEAEGLDLDSFELPEIEDLTLEDLELPEMDELTLDDDLSLEDLDFAVEEDSLSAAEPAQAEPALDLDLSLPLDDSPAAEQVDDLDFSGLESSLESVEDSLDALQDEVGETLQMTESAPAESLGDELDELLSLDEGLDLSTPETPAAPDSDNDVLAALEQELDDDFGFLQGDDEDKTKLDLASAWIDMGDIEGAREILDEVLREGAPEHQELARELLAKIG